MGIATATAIGLGVSAISAGSSFIQASKQKNKMTQAQNAADQYMKDARKKLDVNFYDELSLSMTPYERSREQSLVASTTAMQGAVEGEERGGGVTAGKVLQGQQKLEQDIRDTQIGEMQKLEKLTATEESRLRDEKVKLDTAQAQAEGLKAQYAEAARQKHIQSGIKSAGEFAVGVGKAFPTDYSKLDVSALQQPGTTKAWQPGQDFKLQTPTQSTLTGGGEPSIFQRLQNNPQSSFFQNPNPLFSSLQFPQA